MPRASGSGKRHSGAAGQRDTRHENGLVGPATAKRVVGKRSHAQLDASAQGSQPRTAAEHAASGLPRQSLPTSPPRNRGAEQQPSIDGVCKESHAGNDPGNSVDINGARKVLDALGLDDTSSESGSSLMAPHQTSGAGGVDAGHRQIDVNALKDVNVHRDQGPLELAATVLKALPMQDTLAILIILMHLPALSLLFIYAVFALLTFVPPVTLNSYVSINFAEILDGTATTPAPVTLFTMDVMFFFFWLFLWHPLQELMQDLAKPVIAITLGGGTGSRDGASRGITTTFFWVMLHHILRGTQSHWARIARHIPDNWPVPAAFHEPWKLHEEHYETKGLIGWAKSLLAVHILTQGTIRAIKKWYLRRERENKDGKDGGDPEVGKPHGSTDNAADATLATPEIEINAQQTSAPPLVSKKRRKQSAQIRLQQPLWAALASTKIVFMKEWELSNTSREQAGSNATDVHNLGNAPFERQERQIWIVYVGSDEVHFNTSLFPHEHLEEDSVQGSKDDSIPTTAQKLSGQPLYVRINNAFWQPTRMYPLDAPGGETEEEEEGARWTGAIYGLRPTSKYVVEFVDRSNDTVLFKTSIRTVSEPQRETEAGTAAPPNGQHSLQPDSPATTLKTSIAAAEARLTEEKNRLKTVRKEWKSRINNLKKDIELADNQLSSAGNSDEKYRQKIRQQETQKSQAEREAQALVDQLKNYDAAPELTDRKKKVEKLYGAEKKLYDGEKKDFEEFKSKLDKEVKAKELEHSNLISKVNKIKTRINKIETELANITDANTRGLDEAERRRQERVTWQEHSAAVEVNYRERLAHIRATNAGKVEQIQAMQAQLNAIMSTSAVHMSLDQMAQLGDYQQQQQQQQQQHPGMWNPNPAAPPHIPSNVWGTSGDLVPTVSSFAGPSAWQAMATAAPFEPRAKTRGRSSSMLSDVSGFTQPSDDDEGSLPTWRGGQRPPGFAYPAQGGSSGGGSGQNDSFPNSPVS
ncbi:ubiquitination network signaling protein-like protein [Emericellopsis cladophorae]|uniref:Ubiquitination network signaling protein-like protein n=1 Tax=Emericellopsis cladophorae TaxID=2686198 RepID=A0A9P9Y0Q5_9HYPO|nr:ubiquitination network signaling protein-like protein [Emericellopsis cladophorae]KAI6781225.1 ubiquitination network signaling protein-like protein [Emericellopsis cladophorae]